MMANNYIEDENCSEDLYLIGDLLQNSDFEKDLEQLLDEDILMNVNKKTVEILCKHYFLHYMFLIWIFYVVGRRTWIGY